MSALDVNCFLNIGKSGEEVCPLRPKRTSPDAQLLFWGMQVEFCHAAFRRVPHGEACSDSCLPWPGSNKASFMALSAWQAHA